MNEQGLTHERRPAVDPAVLLIQAEWPARALLRAELEARGTRVFAVSNPPDALRWFSSPGFAPVVIVIDASGLQVGEELDTLLSFCRPAPLVLIVSTQNSPPDALVRAASRVIARPSTVGEIADAVVAFC
ncbi:MAG TPA: hypothetical protein VF960_11210 [Chloroflexota bacterium]